MHTHTQRDPDKLLVGEEKCSETKKMLHLINELCKNDKFETDETLLFKILDEHLIKESSSITRDRDNLFKQLVEFRQDRTGDNLLIYASRCGNLGLLKRLHHNQARVNFNYSNNDGKNALHEACQMSHADCVKFLIEDCKIHVNTLRKGDWTPLMLACTRSNLSIIKYLVEHGADYKQVNKDGWNAFQIAIREGHLDVIEYFLEVDEKLAYETKTRNKRTPMHTACLHGHLSIIDLMSNKLGKEKMNMMLKECDSCGNNAFGEAVIADHVDIVKYLIREFEIDLKHRDAVDNGLIHLAAQAGSIKCLAFLFDDYYTKQHQDLELVDKISHDLNSFRMTPLHSACKNNKADVVEYLIDRIKDDSVLNKISSLVNQKDQQGRSPIEIAHSAKSDTIICLLDIYNLFDK